MPGMQHSGSRQLGINNCLYPCITSSHIFISTALHQHSTAETSSMPMHILQQDQRCEMSDPDPDPRILQKQLPTAVCMRWSPGPGIPTSDQMADTSPRVSPCVQQQYVTSMWAQRRRPGPGSSGYHCIISEPRAILLSTGPGSSGHHCIISDPGAILISRTRDQAVVGITA